MLRLKFATSDVAFLGPSRDSFTQQWPRIWQFTFLLRLHFSRVRRRGSLLIGSKGKYKLRILIAIFGCFEERSAVALH